MHRFRWTDLALMLVLLAPLSAAAHAQSDSAEISGRITDPTGALIGGAVVELSDTARGTVQKATSNHDGIYVFPFVKPGRYSVSVGAAGFHRVDLVSLTANTQDHIEQNFKLEVGSSSESLTVSSDAKVDVGTSISTSVDHRFIENMPLSGQSIQQLIAITPGVQRTSGAGQFSFNGMRDNANYITVDGVSANTGIQAVGTGGLGQYGAGQTGGYSAVGTSSSLGSLGDIQEIKIQASSYPAEFGRSSGGQIQITSQSGTNMPHGNVFEYLRNEDFDAFNSYTKYQNSLVTTTTKFTKPKLRQNDFGGVFGGPIWLPHLYDGRNRSFFFVSYEGLILQQPLSSATNVASACARLGSCTTNGVTTTINPALVPYFLLAPPPNAIVNGTPEYLASYSNPSSSNATSVRLDQQLTSRVSLFARASYTPSKFDVRTANQVANSKYDNKSFTLGANALLSSHISNELRLNYTRNAGASVYTLDTFGGASLPTAAQNDKMFPSQYGATPLNSNFDFASNTGDAFGNINYEVGTNVANTQRQFNLTDNVSWTLGQHNLKFGVDWRRLFPVAAPYVYAQLINYFQDSSLTSGIPDAGIAETDDQVTVHIQNVSFYGQDSWKVSRRLTLDYGVRFDFNPPPAGDGNGQLYAVTSVASPATATLASAGTPLYPTQYNTFQPRAGVAYQFSDVPNYESVLRAGFGLYYDTNDDTATNATAYYPHQRAVILSKSAFPNTPLPPPPAATFIPPYTNQNILGFDPSFTLPLTYQWNVALQQGIGHNQAIQFSYVASSGRNLTRLSQYTGSNFGSRFLNLAVYSSPDLSNYQSLQVAYQRRLFQGLQVLANYVWSKSLDTQSNDTTISPTPTQLSVSGEYGLSTFDARNNFNASISYDFPKVRNAWAPVRYVLQDWSTDSIFLVHTGNPLTATFSKTITGFSSSVFRADVVPNVPVWIPSTTFGGKKLNAAAFSYTFPVTSTRLQGNEPRGYIPGLAIRDLDATLRREFPIHNSVHLQFRADAFNVLNQTLYANPNLSLGTYSSSGKFTPTSGSSAFGIITNTLNATNIPGTNNLAGGFYGIGHNRSLQLALKLKF
jgi:hypothetical protein